MSAEDTNGDTPWKYDIQTWLDALIQLNGEGTTTEINEKVDEILNEHTPNWRTTLNKLQKLEEDGQIEKEKIGNTTVWKLKQIQLDKQIKQLLNQKEVATTKVISEELEKDRNLIEETLEKMEEKGEISKDLVGEKYVWHL